MGVAALAAPAPKALPATGLSSERCFRRGDLQTADDSLAALFGVVLADFPLAFDRFDFDRKTDDGTQ